ncbi:drug resistance MFS transporter, drug:H+ antiporter-2 (14 Spanner) (DHA2) family [compost metagenome]
MPVGQSMAYRAYPPEDRAHLTAVVMTVALLMPALSPAIGGLAADHVSWRWVFVGIAPLAAAIAALALAWAPVDRLAEAKPALDIPGFLLSGLIRRHEREYPCGRHFHRRFSRCPPRSRIATLYLLGFAVDLANMFIFNARYN